MRREFCNPLNISYKFQHYNKQASREAADPTLVFFKGKYYLFASMSAGFYWSKDMLNWQWHENREVDLYRYAPDVRQLGDYLIDDDTAREIDKLVRQVDEKMRQLHAGDSQLKAKEVSEILVELVTQGTKKEYPKKVLHGMI